MKKGILKRRIIGFAEKNELVWYEVFREPKLQKEFRTEYFMKLENKDGQDTIIPFTDTLFRLVEV